MRVALIGATGLIGRSLAPLLATAHDLILIGRRSARVAGADERIGAMSEWPALLAGATIDVAISTLGTTWKQAGTWEAFRAVDVDAVLGFARAARAAGAGQFISVSTVGAAAEHRNQYLALKGEVERDLDAIGFDRLDVIRPGLLVGDRGGDRRIGERIAIALSPLANLVLRGPLDQYASIHASQVATAMAALVGARDDGRHTYFNRDLARLAT